MREAVSEALVCLCRSPSRQQSLQALAGVQAVKHRALQALALLASRPASEWCTDAFLKLHSSSSLGSTEKALRCGYGTGLHRVMCRSMTPLRKPGYCILVSLLLTSFQTLLSLQACATDVGKVFYNSMVELDSEKRKLVDIVGFSEAPAHIQQIAAYACMQIQTS